MSSIKCVSLVATGGAAITGGLTFYNGMKARKKGIAVAEQIAKHNNGKIPTGGMTKDGKLWDGFTTVDQVKKDTKKQVALMTTLSAIGGAIGTAVISGLTLLAKSKLK